MDKLGQAEVIREVYNLFWDYEPRAATGVEFLATYRKIRPGELRQVKESHLDLRDGWITIPNPKEQSDPKKIKLIPKHIRLLRKVCGGNPDRFLLSFKDGRRFGRDYLYNAWKKACANLKIEGVPLYPGTKHTSATELAKKFPYRLVKEAAGVTSKAMDRYINLTEVDVISLYESAAPEFDNGKSG